MGGAAFYSDLLEKIRRMLVINYIFHSEREGLTEEEFQTYFSFLHETRLDTYARVLSSLKKLTNERHLLI